MNQYEKNKDIEQLVVSKNDFTPDELNYISQYTGMGGLEKYGAKGEGLLYEYYTPNVLVKKMWALAIKYGFGGGKILEPSTGIGRFLLYAGDNDVLGYEINPISAKICRLLNPNVRLIEKSFTYHFWKNGQAIPFEKDFDLVIGNPPYGDFEGANQASEIKHFKLPDLRFDQYFILRSLDCLKSGGLLVFVVTDNLFQGSYLKTVEAIESKAELLDAYLLPSKTFPTTKIATSLIVLRKK